LVQENVPMILKMASLSLWRSQRSSHDGVVNRRCCQTCFRKLLGNHAGLRERCHPTLTRAALTQRTYRSGFLNRDDFVIISGVNTFFHRH
jgi:hypothetical protein